MRSDAFITVTCDKCNYNENIELCACVQNSWDERYVNGALKEGGWTTDGDLDICESCSEEVEE